MNLEEVILNKTKEVIASGKVDELVAASIQSTVESILTNCLRNYGDAYKALQSKITESLVAGLDTIKIPEFAQTMAKFAEIQATQYLKGQAELAINASFKDLFAPVPESISMEEFLKTVADSYKKDVRDDLYCVIDVKESGWERGPHYTITIKADNNEYSNSVKIHVSDCPTGENKGKMYISWLEDGNRNFAKHNYGIDAWIYRMTIQSTLIADIADYEGTHSYYHSD